MRVVAATIALTGVALLTGSCASTPQQADAADAALAQRVVMLELRKTRVEDVNAIKRLQRAYGYYIDEGRWDEVADLFASNASIEIGLDGVYQGREHIRAYYKALGGGRNGLAPGQLNEYLQLMPVITVGIDGHSAEGTWRAVILAGHKGRDAFWGEGPYENQYVKENGVWRISRLHWFQTLYAPYAGGWANNADANDARFVTAALKPDAPTTINFKHWPGAFTPPFHFRGKYPGFEPIPVPAQIAPLTHQAMTSRVAQLAADVQHLADQDQIENLQRIYGFYIDKGQWSDAAALFAQDAQFEIQGRGVWQGPARILQYFRAVGPEGLQPGRLYDHMQLQPITHVAADGKTARGRWHLFAQLAQHGKFAEWETGVYENEYVKQNGIWKIHRLHLYPTMITPYEDGWGKTSLSRSQFEPDLKPDLASRVPSQFDHAFVAPYHYDNPVRHAYIAARAIKGTSTEPIDAQLARVEHQLSLVEARAEIENIQTVYGYYLATLLWDDLAALFADNGTIEIAQRGVYVGRPAVRRNLNLYGQAGLDDGVLHNHMQYQMVINVADDGQSAKLRSRALSMMGNFNRSSMWMGGVYENQFVKVNGRWMFIKDQQINTYFAPYETGWKDLPQRPAPGITASNPPDRPPSFPFDLYPKNFLPPYHYANPVVTPQAASP
ncbi:MAG: nuclear transport factor 2 family protein [Pseudomonadota bacterium]